ncbi:MAG: ATP-binding protein [Paracoccus sp. (in: a-proteobacteria)]|nr:ATP-binding protein [Paracoccus sp. (in: a-proteobacteria)]
MPNARFDSRLYRVLALLGALTLIVGLLAIGVNRYLVRIHDATLARALPVVEAAGRVRAAADLAATLTDAVRQAGTAAELDALYIRLEGALDGITVGVDALADIAAVPDISPDVVALRNALDPMAQSAAAVIRLGQRRADLARSIAETGDRISALIEAQTDLARLRMTATIADLHDGELFPSRSLLDALADRHVFAFERTTELARQAELLRINGAQMAVLGEGGQIVARRQHQAALIAQAGRRMDYLPSAQAQAAVRNALAEYRRDALGAVSATHVAGIERLDRDLARFRAQLADVLRSVHALQVAAQRENLARIARDAVQAERVFALLLAVVALAVITAAVVSYYARHRLLARMDRVTSRLVSVAGGDFGQPLSVTGPDEIGRMEQALNILRLRAQEALHLRHDMEQAVRTATRDLVDEMQAAAAARNAAVQADRGKSVFLARMSHEIRTPLNGMIGMLELMAAAEKTPDGRLRLNTALTSARDLLGIANEILDFAATDVADGAARPVHFWLRDLIGQIHAPLAALAVQKGLAVSVDLAEDAPPVLRGDVVRIRQVMTNLVSNAVKYTERGGIALLIDHAADPATGQPVFSFAVSDTGAGMTREQVARIFEGYGRPDWLLRAGGEGAGLGLLIAQRLTDAMGGGLSVESVPGVGSCVTLTLPLEIGDPDQIALSDPPPMRQFGATVLVVDDHPVNCMVARGFLERMGCRVIEAETAAAADAVIAAGGFDLALVDLNLPDRPGHQVIAALRERRPGLPVAALTADPVADDPDASHDLDVDAVLAKPVSPRELAELLERLMSAQPPVSLDQDIAEIGPDMVQAMVAAFLEDLPGALDAITGTTGEARRKAAHRLKGAASNFGLEAFRALLAAIEAAPENLDEPRLRAEAGRAHAALVAAARRSGI